MQPGRRRHGGPVQASGGSSSLHNSNNPQSSPRVTRAAHTLSRAHAQTLVPHDRDARHTKFTEPFTHNRGSETTPHLAGVWCSQRVAACQRRRGRWRSWRKDGRSHTPCGRTHNGTPIKTRTCVTGGSRASTHTTARLMQKHTLRHDTQRKGSCNKGGGEVRGRRPWQRRDKGTASSSELTWRRATGRCSSRSQCQGCRGMRLAHPFRPPLTPGAPPPAMTTTMCTGQQTNTRHSRAEHTRAPIQQCTLICVHAGEQWATRREAAGRTSGSIGTSSSSRAFASARSIGLTE